MSNRYDQTFTESPEWKAWVREQELNNDPRYDVQAVEKTGWMSVDHFEAFAKFAGKQHEMKLLLQFHSKIKGLSQTTLNI